MVIKPKFRGFICTTAHPVGCAKQVQAQIDYVKEQPMFDGPKRVLVIGASTGYGLATRIAATFGSGADSVGVFFEKAPSSGRTGTAGWYNAKEFVDQAKNSGYKAFNINGDAFSHQIKNETIACIKKELGQVDCVVYSLASPKRIHPDSGEVFSSVIKPLKKPYTNKTVNFHTGEVTEVTIDPATEEEVQQTIAVMGGEDWEMWMDALNEAGALAEGVKTVAYSYIGPELTHPIYKDGTIGKAKNHLQETVDKLNEMLKNRGGQAYLSVNKALVTQSSSAIPIVPLYISLLYKVMEEKGVHEGCIEQMYRLFSQELYKEITSTDEQSRIRMDNYEMQPDIQEWIASMWSQVHSNNVYELTDLEAYRDEFFQLFGFRTDGIDYEEDVCVDKA